MSIEIMCFLNRDTQDHVINYLNEIGFYSQPIIKKTKIKRDKNKLSKAEKVILMDFFILNFKNKSCNVGHYLDCNFFTCRKNCLIKDILKPNPPTIISRIMPGNYNTVPR